MNHGRIGRNLGGGLRCFDTLPVLVLLISPPLINQSQLLAVGFKLRGFPEQEMIGGIVSPPAFLMTTSQQLLWFST